MNEEIENIREYNLSWVMFFFVICIVTLLSVAAVCSIVNPAAIEGMMNQIKEYLL